MRTEFSIMAGDRLPSYSSTLHTYSVKYEILLIALIKLFCNNNIYIPCCLAKFLFNYALYMNPAIDMIKSLKPMDKYDPFLIPRDTNIQETVQEIIDFIVPFTPQCQKTYQLPYDLITTCTSNKIGQVFINIINFSRNTNLVQNIVWLMLQIENVSFNNKSAWNEFAGEIDLCHIAFKFRENRNLQYNLWLLISAMTAYDDDKKSRRNLTHNIYFLILQELNDNHIRTVQFYNRIDLCIIQEITNTFRNFAVFQADDIWHASNYNIFTRIIELILRKNVQFATYIEEEENDTNLIDEMTKITSNIWYNIIESITYLLCTNVNLIYKLVDDNSHIITDDIIITKYVKLLNNDDPILREYIQEIIINVTINEDEQLIQQYLDLGLAEQMSHIFSNNKHLLFESEINNYLEIIKNIHCCSDDMISSLILTSNTWDQIIHWLLINLQKTEHYWAYRGIVLILREEHNLLFKKVIQFENGLILKIFNQKLCKFILDTTPMHHYNPINKYIALENGHIYIILTLLILFIQQTIQQKKQNNNNNTELTNYIYNYIDIQQIDVFMTNSYPSLCNIFNDEGLNHGVAWLKENGKYFNDYNTSHEIIS